MLTHIPPDMTLTRRERDADRAQRRDEKAALTVLHNLEAELRQHASVTQDEYVAAVANAMRDALKVL